jgi:hypothetical protein
MTFHPFLWNESGGLNPTAALMIAGITDYPSAAVVATSTLYGASRNFLTLAITSPQSVNLRICLLYE